MIQRSKQLGAGWVRCSTQNVDDLFIIGLLHLYRKEDNKFTTGLEEVVTALLRVRSGDGIDYIFDTTRHIMMMG